MSEIILDERARMVEARVDIYLHIAKRMAMEHFGSSSEPDHNKVIADIAAAMVNLEAAHVMADAEQYG